MFGLLLIAAAVGVATRQTWVSFDCDRARGSCVVTEHGFFSKNARESAVSDVEMNVAVELSISRRRGGELQSGAVTRRWLSPGDQLLAGVSAPALDRIEAYQAARQIDAFVWTRSAHSHGTVRPERENRWVVWLFVGVLVSIGLGSIACGARDLRGTVVTIDGPLGALVVEEPTRRAIPLDAIVDVEVVDGQASSLFLAVLMRNRERIAITRSGADERERLEVHRRRLADALAGVAGG